MAGKKQKPRSITALDQAIKKFEASEQPFYDGIVLLKQAAKDLGPFLTDLNKYRNAMRAINWIAAKPCESGQQPKHLTCAAAIKAGDLTPGHQCWPCYAREQLKAASTLPTNAKQVAENPIPQPDPQRRDQGTCADAGTNKP